MIHTYNIAKDYVSELKIFVHLLYLNKTIRLI